jgi:hypothetical protein
MERYCGGRIFDEKCLTGSPDSDAAGASASSISCAEIWRFHQTLNSHPATTAHPSYAQLALGMKQHCDMVRNKVRIEF